MRGRDGHSCYINTAFHPRVVLKKENSVRRYRTARDERACIDGPCSPPGLILRISTAGRSSNQRIHSIYVVGVVCFQNELIARIRGAGEISSARRRLIL